MKDNFLRDESIEYPLNCLLLPTLIELGPLSIRPLPLEISPIEIFGDTRGPCIQLPWAKVRNFLISLGEGLLGIKITFSGFALRFKSVHHYLYNLRFPL